MNTDHIYLHCAAAAVRSQLPDLPDHLTAPALTALDAASLHDIYQRGRQAELRLAAFKRNAELPRIRRVLGMLKALQPRSLLDIGSGRGTFLWPLLTEWPATPITAIDLLTHRCQGMHHVATGGIANLQVTQADACALPFANGSFDIITALEVLEHIPDIQTAAKELVRVHARAILISVPAQEDDNPEHLRLVSREMLTELFTHAHTRSIRFEHVRGHLIALILRHA